MKHQEAKFYKKLADSRVTCQLCPRNCTIPKDAVGYCEVRENHDGILYSATNGHPAAMRVDRIEKYGFDEFLPGSRSLAVGSYGCNLNCDCCKNRRLAGGQYPVNENIKEVTPREVIDMALHYQCSSITFTHNEPTIFIEYAMAISACAAQSNLDTVIMTNGYISPAAREQWYPTTAAAGFSLKTFSDAFYRNHCNCPIAPVLESIEYYFSLGKHLELTMLVIPGYNDDADEINRFLDYVAQKLNHYVPLHFTALVPGIQQHNLSPSTTNAIFNACNLALGRGFTSVYSK